MDSPAPKTGYLTDDFRLFHLTAPVPSETAPHYHDFCKILVLLKGSIGYTIEGRSYQLLPGDIVLVNHGEIHCPHPGERTFYERLILYLSPLFLEQVSPEAAERLVVAFEKTAGSLDTMPQRCPWFSGEYIPKNVYRSILFEKRYLLLFQIVDGSVYVDYVLDCRQDYSWLIK